MSFMDWLLESGGGGTVEYALKRGGMKKGGMLGKGVGPLKKRGLWLPTNYT